MSISFEKISKIFADGTIALDKFDLEFEKGEFIVLLGPSGSGKTTACRILAGLEEATSGSITNDRSDITYLAPRERNMSMVFQNYALYGHKTVFENIAYPLRVRKIAKGNIDSLVRDIARVLQIEQFLDRKPAQLSGGQAQRVAVARALVWNPEICLMDEPLSNLDAILRLQTRTEIKRLHSDLGHTFVFVTHDQEEAMTLGTRIAVLCAGKLVQFSTPRIIYHQPATRFVAEFIGRPAMNIIEGEVFGGMFRAGVFGLPITNQPDGPVAIGIRPEQIRFWTEPTDRTIEFNLDVLELIEPDTLLFVNCGDASLVVRVMRDVGDIGRGSIVHLEIPNDALHFFEMSDGRRRT